MAMVWQKDAQAKLDPMVEQYEIGRDFELDGKLFRYELAASQAHSKMLQKIGILNEAEEKSIDKEIRKLCKEMGAEIKLQVSEEDIHSKLENLLTAAIGETGKKIHTGRSRNDQVMVVMRLFEKEKLLEIGLEYIKLLETVIAFAEREGKTILPGYTHTKQAMLINVKFWALSFVELGADNLLLLKSVYSLLDSNPLGSGSGFGVPVPLDRKMTSDLLGFSRVQINPMAVQNSRGKYEGNLIDSFWNIMNDFSRMAADMLLYNMDELLYVETTPAITTGSSIMPQKRNLDVMELVRARTNVMLSYSNTVKTVVTGILSGYNRDLQETKGPMFDAINLITASIKAVRVVFENIRFDADAVKARLTAGIFATDIAFDAVAKGMPFRDAYKLAAKKIGEIEVNEETIRSSLENRVSIGSPDTLSVHEFNELIQPEKKYFEAELSGFRNKIQTLIG